MAVTIETCDDSENPYHLCAACHRRLHALALRPVEWYNLAKRHGWMQHLLHDDFYDQDGTADQPTEAVDDPAKHPAPVLEAVAGDPSMLLDYSITRWSMDSSVTAAWAVFSRRDVLAVVSERFGATANSQIRSRLLEICSRTLFETGASFVRYAWGEYPETLPLGSLAAASAACLPFRDGFDRVVAALGALSGSQ